MIRKFYVDDLFDSKFMEENNDSTVVKAREILKLVTDYNTEITKKIEFKMLTIVVYGKTFNIRNDINIFISYSFVFRYRIIQFYDFSY